MAAIPLVVPELEVGQQVRRQLRDVAKDYSVALRPANIHAIKGRPFEEICRLAQEIDVDLIVMATRGNTGLKHLVLGSTAERVVRYSPCPVLVVHGSDSKKKSAQRLTTFRKFLSQSIFRSVRWRDRVCQSASQPLPGKTDPVALGCAAILRRAGGVREI